MTQWSQTHKKESIAIIVTAVVLIIIIIILLSVFLKNKTDIPEITIPRIPQWYFMAIISTDLVKGRRTTGDLIDNNNIIESGLDSVEDLAKYPVQFAAGHDYYNHSTTNQRFRPLNTYTSWSAFVLDNATKLSKTSRLDDVTKVLEITADYPCVSIDDDVVCAGIVVRHGGVLFINPSEYKTINIRTDFILVESGGVLQSGSNFHGAKYRTPATSKVNIVINTPDTGIRHQGTVASQYSYKIYNPGVVKSDPAKTPLFSSYTGKDGWNNYFGPRVVACGFNGTLHLAGAVSEEVSYEGTWNASTDDAGNNVFLGGKNDLLTVDAFEGNEITDTYPNTFTHLDGPDIATGSTMIQLDVAVKNKLSTWLPGSKILITCKTTEFSNNNGNTDGRVPLWLDWDDEAERAENERMNSTCEFIKDSIDGVEIATIRSIDMATATITLAEGLKYRHLNTRAKLERDDGSVNGQANTIFVDTRVHVALLTRNIVIQPEVNASGKGQGMNMWYNDMSDLSSSERVNDQWIGSGGSVVCSYAPPGKTSGSENITPQCYDPVFNKDPEVNTFCGETRPVANDRIRGNFIHGTASITSANAILGCHAMFRMGSNVQIDSVEVFRGGLAGNVGQIGRYPLHFHMAGFTSNFLAYRPADARNIDKRQGLIANCSVYCSFNRWIVAHGTMEATVRNNVGFISRGSGYFVEDGIESITFEHNIGCATLKCQADEYYNPVFNSDGSYNGTQYIFPIESSDFLFPSVFWLKFNQTRCLRNITCNLATPVAGFWFTATNTSNLRGYPTVMIGDEYRQLPALADIVNATSNLNQDFRGGEACWSPDNIKEILGSGTTGCVAQATRANSSTPISCFAENVGYQSSTFTSTFPDFYFRFDGNFPGIRNVGPVFLPLTAHNACAMSQEIGQANYFEMLFGAGSQDYQYQPIDQAELNTLDAQGYTTSLDSKSTTLPFIWSGMLTFNLGAPDNQLYTPTQSHRAPNQLTKQEY